MESVQTLDLSIPVLSESVSLPVAPKRGRPRGSGPSIRAQVIAYKKEHPTATVKQTAEALGLTNTSSIRKAFTSLRKSKAKVAVATKEQPPESPPTRIRIFDGAHPLTPVFFAAVQQVTKGKGVRHGGDSVPFLDQPWAHYAKMHGRGFLTGQAAKKLEEAATTKEGDAFVQEMLGAMVYIGMAILHTQGERK